MKLTQKEITEELAHQQKILRARRDNLRILESQEASYGIDVPLHIVNHIARLTEQIHAHETEINRLETLAVEGVLPLAEVEYRVVVAEAWDTPQGYPTVVGRTHLEYARLRLHITPERSKEIEREIRNDLAWEGVPAFGFSGKRTFSDWLDKKDDMRFEDMLTEQELKCLFRSIKLSPEAMLEFILEEFCPVEIVNKEAFCWMFTTHVLREDMKDIRCFLSSALDMPLNSVPDDIPF